MGFVTKSEVDQLVDQLDQHFTEKQLTDAQREELLEKLRLRWRLRDAPSGGNQVHASISGNTVGGSLTSAVAGGDITQSRAHHAGGDAAAETTALIQGELSELREALAELDRRLSAPERDANGLNESLTAIAAGLGLTHLATPVRAIGAVIGKLLT